VQRTTWRWVFWMVPIIAIPAALTISVLLPLKHDGGNYIKKFQMIDYGGIILNLAAITLILVLTLLSLSRMSRR
jgi:predicted MFS family arabinose efflux permease